MWISRILFLRLRWLNMLVCFINFAHLILRSFSLDEGLFFQIVTPSKLSFIYQINPSYHIGIRFPTYTLKNMQLIYADPPEGCVELENAELVANEVILLERGGCPFVQKVLNAEKAGAKIAIVTDSKSGSDEFIDMVTDDTKRKSNIPAAFLPGNSGRRLRNYLLYEGDSESPIFIDIPLNYTNRSLKDTFGQKPPWELW